MACRENLTFKGTSFGWIERILTGGKADGGCVKIDWLANWLRLERIDLRGRKNDGFRGPHSGMSTSWIREFEECVLYKDNCHLYFSNIIKRD